MSRPGESSALYTMFATDPDGLLIDVLVPREPGWVPPFVAEPFVGLGRPAAFRRCAAQLSKRGWDQN